MALLCLAACGSPSETHDDAAVSDGHHDGAPDAPAVFPATLDGNRERLLATYLAYLETMPTVQSLKPQAGMAYRGPTVLVFMSTTNIESLLPSAT